MKVAFAVLTLCLVAQLPSTNSAESCLRRHNVTSSQVEAVAPNTPVADISSNIKCYSLCVISDYIGSDNKVDLQLVGTRASPQEQRILVECKKQIDDNTNLEKCDYAYLMLQCLFLAKTNGGKA
ncbi:uncharacterized protein Obp18a [Drosophila kikkawai]|uniref:Uncharacterized protein Obp18a n=1 Tax=Drosophila kikkawai TaxID=30033 RepID=A0A6P4J6U5_DROKI|nr:uncharacterized protein LOC108085224 [Drosophila kikkawai]